MIKNTDKLLPAKVDDFTLPELESKIDSDFKELLETQKRIFDQTDRTAALVKKSTEDTIRLLDALEKLFSTPVKQQPSVTIKITQQIEITMNRGHV